MSLYIFDKDGTLVSHRGGLFARREPPTRPEQQFVRKHVVEWLARLRQDGHAIAIATNIPAVAFGKIDLATARQLVEDCARKVGGVNAWRLSPYDPGARLVNALKRRHNAYDRDDPCRKPHPGMILELMAELGYPAADTIFIGDKRLDREAARAAHVRFVPASRFFRHRPPVSGGGGFPAVPSALDRDRSPTDSNRTHARGS